ncbi:sensor histidine kinase [Actinomadura craniellae]|uniref:histidine kinase n=1 Tax=Actinomadura craniellae TaxID=2231787 RepID=A0A365H9A9_9ACTN|nr:sensor histidine kinase [Actinomadura craniellae]RAY15667.1 sensor histidine kinase [Actinomadura craniellae]
MSDHPAHPRWPRPGELPAWVVPLLVGVVQLAGSFGAQSDKYGPHGGPHLDDPRHHMFRELDPFGVALLVAGPVLLLARRRYPIPVALGTGLVTLLYYLRAHVYGPAFLAAAVALVAVVVAGHRLLAWVGTLTSFAAFFAVASLIGVDVERRGQGDRLFPVDRPGLATAALLLGWAFVVLIGADLVRIRSEKAAEAARGRAEEDRRRASDERLRIARELHDVLAHNISMINVQAGVALHLMDDDPGQARTALAAIKEASKEALTEMRSVIGVLRQQGEVAPRSPTAGLDRLEELVGRAESAGLRVRAEFEGDRRPLPAGVDLAAFRIVQESLTNVTRHAGPGPLTALVRISYAADHVSVQVEDDGRGVSLLDDHPGGNGIHGMRERAAALGGTFSAGPRPGGGFQVRAVLPVHEGTEEK